MLAFKRWLHWCRQNALMRPNRMADKNAVFVHIQTTLAELFELDPSIITLKSELYEELDIDSIDAVDLIIELKNYTGEKMAPDDFKTARTVEDLVNAVIKLLDQ